MMQKLLGAACKREKDGHINFDEFLNLILVKEKSDPFHGVVDCMGLTKSMCFCLGVSG